MKYTPYMAVLLTLIGVVSVGQAQSRIANSGYWERTITARNTGASSMETTKTWWEGDRKRTEQYTVGGVIVEIKNGSTLYRYIPVTKKAIKITLPQGKAPTVQQEIESLVKVAQANTKKGKKIGTGKSVAGLRCDAYKVSQGKETATIYVSTDSHFPIVLNAQVTSGSRTEVTSTRSLKLNYNVPDSMFTLPKGVKVEEVKPQTPPNKGG